VKRKNEGASGDVDENKGSLKTGVRFQVPGASHVVTDLGESADL
jgi:hypothetical protein